MSKRSRQRTIKELDRLSYSLFGWSHQECVKLINYGYTYRKCQCNLIIYTTMALLCAVGLGLIFFITSLTKDQGGILFFIGLALMVMYALKKERDNYF